MKDRSSATAPVVDLGADGVKALLSVDPHPTCGFVAETLRLAATHADAAEWLPDLSPAT